MNESNATRFGYLWKPLAVTAALAFLYYSVLVKLAENWWTDENYSHGLLVPFVIGFIVWLEFENLRQAIKKPEFFAGFVLISGALLMLFVGTLGAEIFTQRASLVLMLAGIIVYFFGREILQKLAVPLLLLALAIPIPLIIFNKIALPLQMWASQAAGWAIRLYGIAAERTGNIIEIVPLGESRPVGLEVVEACSGIRSLMTLLTLALVLAYFTRDRREGGGNGFSDILRSRNFFRAALMLLFVVPIALISNASRVAATGILTYYYGQDFAEGSWHDISGWLVYLLALLMLAGTNQLAKRIFASDASVIKATGFLSRPHRSATSSLAAIIVIVVISTGGIFITWFESRMEITAVRRPLVELPSKLGKWEQIGDDVSFDAVTEDILRTSDYIMRDYSSPETRLNVYIGYYASQRTGATHHSPQSCLPGSGWEMRDGKLMTMKTPAGKTIEVNRYVVTRGSYSEVLIYWYQGRGRTTANEFADKAYMIWDSIVRSRSDGAMVRVMAPVGDDEPQSVADALDLASNLADKITPFVPQ